MIKSKSKAKLNKWFFLGLTGVILGAPNGAIIKYAIADFNPTYFVFLRFAVTFIASMPFLLSSKKKYSIKSIQYSVLAGIVLFIAVITYTLAIKFSTASYASLIALLSPIFLIFYSIKLNKERISRRAAAGITLSAAGAFLMIFFPIAIKQNADLQIYPLATALMLVNCATYPLMVILAKKANDRDLSMPSIISLSSLTVAVLSGITLIIIDNPVDYTIKPKAWLAILFTGLVVSLLARVASIRSYEYVGSVVSSALEYLGHFLSILIPVIALGEKLSVAMVAGGALILLGIYIIEHHKSKHYKYFHIFKHN